jgi:hypothetical protein
MPSLIVDLVNRAHDHKRPSSTVRLAEPYIKLFPCGGTAEEIGEELQNSQDSVPVALIEEPMKMGIM